MRIAYFGSGVFSRYVLEGILSSSYGDSVKLIITKQDKHKGRGKILLPTPVKDLALSRGIDYVDNYDIKSREFVEFLKSGDFDVFLVCDYGKIIPRSVFEIPVRGSVGIHPSLLPSYRGPSPIHYAILNGDKKTGTTLFYINEIMDAGDIILQKEITIDDNDDYTSLSKKLSDLSVELVLDFLSMENINAIPQNESMASYTRMIEKKDGKIDWNESAEKIHCKVRAFIEWPKAYCFYKGMLIKVLKARYVGEDLEGEVGQIVRLGDTLGVKTGKGILEVEKLLPESSKAMDAKSFINGYRVKIGDKFE
ncbi:MAG: methionyl-tRNA formyltransferase [Brevinematales bacterium]|nr:methionyl-tRNA formyltransferase [Brevinematales bacterium]